MRKLLFSCWPFLIVMCFNTNADIPNPIPNNQSVSVSIDFDGDAKGDVLYRDTNSNAWTVHSMDSASPRFTSSVDGMTVITSWQYNGAGDFDGDGYSDVIIRNATSGSWYMYKLQNNSIVSRGYVGIENAEEVAVQAVADFNNDGFDDVLLRNEVTGTWLMNLLQDRTIIDTISPAMSQVLSWNIVGVKDFDGNASSDILIRNASSGTWYIYLYENTDISSRGYISALTSDLSDVVQATGDFNGDGKNDVLMRNSTSGAWSVAYMNGRTPYETSAIDVFTSKQ